MATPIAGSNAAITNVDAGTEEGSVTTAKLQQIPGEQAEHEQLEKDNKETMAPSKKLFLCRRFKDSSGVYRNFNSLPLFIYATSPSTCATSADGVGVCKEVAAVIKNDTHDLALCTLERRNTTKATAISSSSSAYSGKVDSSGGDIVDAIDRLTLNGISAFHPLNTMASSSPGATSTGTPTMTVVGGVASGLAYQHHLNMHPHLLNHHLPFINTYPLQHTGSHHHLHSDQTKSLQELQHEVGALLEFRDLVIETFPDLKQKMASMSSTASTSAGIMGGGSGSGNASTVSGTNTLTGGISNSSLASRREWEPGIRSKRKISQQKEPSTSTTAVPAGNAATNGTTAAGELSSSSLTRSRSNSHSGKKEPKSGENNNGSVVQDSGFSTETSSSKEGHSASSTNGAMNGAMATNRLSCLESDDELLNLLDVIHRKSTRLREEVEHLQNYELRNLRDGKSNSDKVSTGATNSNDGAVATTKSESEATVAITSELTPKTFREHVERLNKEDIKQLRKERDRLLDKLAEMEAETLTGRIKAAKMNDQMEELMNVKKDLEEQLKLAMAQKLELSSRIQQMQQQPQSQSKSSSSQSDYSSQRNFSSSVLTVLSTGSGGTHLDCGTSTTATSVVSSSAAATTTTTVPFITNRRQQNTFQPVVIEQHQGTQSTYYPFHQSTSSDKQQQQNSAESVTQPLGRLDGIVSTPWARNTKCRATDSNRVAAILLETNVIELQRHLLTLTVQNQVLMQKLEQATKSKSNIAKRLDKSNDDVEDLRFQLEEKNIELEGTKAQLRVLESRMHTSIPSSGIANSSFAMHSQNDYETNRSSASTTLVLSRRRNSVADSRSDTPISQAGQMPAPNSTQISTPSMKAMIPLAMDEMQQHSSSTESAHENQNESPHDIAGDVRLMSTSVGGMSPFEHGTYTPRVQQAARKFGATKPSKIPLPGNKSISYFGAKPPTGRPSTAGRSPPSANTSTGSSKSSLSRSTGNLLYSRQSPNSLKSADSAQSIRKDNSSSFSNNTSRSSTSSSIPTPYAASTKSQGLPITNPSPRVLQNSPLPKLKRETLTSRLRHLDSLSRMHQQNSFSNTSNGSDNSNATTTTPVTGSPTRSTSAVSSYIVSSTPKPSAIAAQFNASTLRNKDSNSFQRRATSGGASSSTATSTTRRFSSASVVSTRIAAARNHEAAMKSSTIDMRTSNAAGGVGSGGGGGGGGVNQNGTDSDSGKSSILYCNKTNYNNSNYYNKTLNNKAISATNNRYCANHAHNLSQSYWINKVLNENQRRSTSMKTTASKETNQARKTNGNAMKIALDGNDKCNINNNSNKISTEATKRYLQLYLNPNYLQSYSVGGNMYQYEKHPTNKECQKNAIETAKNVEEEGIVDPMMIASNKLLLTFDYGSTDSIDTPQQEERQTQRKFHAIKEEQEEMEVEQRKPTGNCLDMSKMKNYNSTSDLSEFLNENVGNFWFNYAHKLEQQQFSNVNNINNNYEEDPATAFQVHRMQHTKESLQKLNSSSSSMASTAYGSDDHNESYYVDDDDDLYVDIAYAGQNMETEV